MTPHPDRDVELLCDGIALDDFLPYLLNRITNRLNTELADELRRLGTSVPHWRVLAVLKTRDGRNIGELAVYTVIEQSTLSRIIVRMEKEGLVERRPAPEDGRGVKVFLRPQGQELFDRVLPIALRHYRGAVAGLNDAELATLVDSLHKVLDNVRRSPYR